MDKIKVRYPETLSTQMRVLQICPKPLFEPMDGGKLAMEDLATGLKEQGVELVQLMIETPTHPLPPNFRNSENQRSVFLDTKVKATGALLNFFSQKSYNLARFNRKQLYDEIRSLIAKKDFDIIQAEGIFALPEPAKIRPYTKAKIILRAHNVEHLIWKRRAQSGTNPFVRYYLALMAGRLQKEETYCCNSVDGIVPVSEIDREILSAMAPGIPAQVIGIGTRLKRTGEIPASIPPTVFHIGAMDWGPNVEGVRWFVSEVWPLVRKQNSELKLRLAGKAMPGEFEGRGDEAIEVRIVEKASEFMLAEGLMVVPLLSGSGIRVKIIEAMALGKCVIATSIAAEGLGVESGRHLFIADTPLEMAARIRECFERPQLVQEISENALIFASNHFDSKKLSAQLLNFYNELPGT